MQCLLTIYSAINVYWTHRLLFIIALISLFQYYKMHFFQMIRLICCYSIVKSIRNGCKVVNKLITSFNFYFHFTQRSPAVFWHWVLCCYLSAEERCSLSKCVTQYSPSAPQLVVLEVFSSISTLLSLRTVGFTWSPGWLWLAGPSLYN